MPKLVPNEEKKRKGTFRPCRAKPLSWATANTIYEVTPTGLDADGKKAWDMALAQAPKGLLSPTDAHLLKRWCDDYSQYEFLRSHFSRDKMTIKNAQGNLTTAPWFYQMRALANEMLNLERQLGFTPCARARVRVIEEPTETVNPFQELLEQ